MSTLVEGKELHPFVAQFLEQGGMQADECGAWLVRYQNDARAKLSEVSIPGRKDEEWRFIKLDGILKSGYLRNEAATFEVSADDVRQVSFEEEVAARLVFVNGQFQEGLSTRAGLPEGTLVTNWSELVRREEQGALQEVLGSTQYWSEDLFYQLNGAGFRDGAVVVVPRNAVVEKPIHLLYLSGGAEGRFAMQPRNVIVAGESAEFTVVEEYRGEDEAEYFTNVVDEVLVGRNATVRHFKVQRDGECAYHIARNAIRLEQDANYVGTAINFGALLSRNDSYAYYNGENIDCTLDGLAYLRGEQVSDTHTAIDHRLPNSRSYQLHKTVVDDRAHSVFNGKIFVRQDAQQTRSEQLNQNLVLSKKGHVDTKPQLEILADDVVCSHGATVGQLEEEQAFYLMSRGIEKEQARAILTFAFAAEVLETITINSLRKALEAELMDTTE